MTRTELVQFGGFRPAAGRETREALLARYVDEDILETHPLATPTAGHIRHDRGATFEAAVYRKRYGLRGLGRIRSAGMGARGYSRGGG